MSGVHPLGGTTLSGHSRAYIVNLLSATYGVNNCAPGDIVPTPSNQTRVPPEKHDPRPPLPGNWQQGDAGYVRLAEGRYSEASDVGVQQHVVLDVE